jgi:pimeloyl-ACP methyl ester carboxylesterase
MGDQDTPAHEAGRFIRDHAPHAGLAVLPMCGHTLNLEEPMLFNHLLEDFLSAVDAGRWGSWRSAAGAARA